MENIWQFIEETDQPGVHVLHRHSRPLLCGLDQAHGSALDHHVDRLARVGAPMMISRTWYEARNRAVIEFPDNLPRGSDHKGVIRYHLAFCDEGVGANQAVLTNSSAVQDRRSHAYQCILANYATMEHGLVANGASVSNRKREPTISVQDSIVLDVALLPNSYDLVIASQNRTEPNARCGIKLNISNKDRSLCGPRRFVHARRFTFKTIERHAYHRTIVTA